MPTLVTREGKARASATAKVYNTTPWKTAPPKGGGKDAPTLEDRKRRLKDIKARSRCNAFKEMGHWAGDPECKGKPRTSMVAFTGERDLPLRDEGDEQPFAPTSSVAVSSVSRHQSGKTRLSSSFSSSTPDVVFCRRACVREGEKEEDNLVLPD